MLQKNTLAEMPVIERIGKEEPLTVDSSTLFEGDALTVLRRLEPQSVRCVITSPPIGGYALMELMSKSASRKPSLNF